MEVVHAFELKVDRGKTGHRAQSLSEPEAGSAGGRGEGARDEVQGAADRALGTGGRDSAENGGRRWRGVDEPRSVLLSGKKKGRARRPFFLFLL